MTKNDKAIYAPGELSRVRNQLGSFDDEEAKDLARKLGGEIGYERSEEQEKARQAPRRTRHEKVDVKIGDQPGRPRRRVDLAPDDEGDGSKKRSGKGKGANPFDDPSVPLRMSYWDRIKMDKFLGQPEFEIKSPSQVLQSIISVFGDVPDYVSPVFVSQRMPEYYKKIETMVTTTRTLFPRKNTRRSEGMKKSSPLVYSILDVIRYWNIEKISGDLAKIQAHPKSARVSEFADILRAVYRPLFVLSLLDSDAHIRGAYKILYKLLYIENPTEAQDKSQELIRTTLAALFEVRRNIHYLLYPLLMKSVSSRFVNYDRFFIDRKNRILSFLNISEDDRINPGALVMQGDAKDLKPGEDEVKGESEDKTDEKQDEEKEVSEEEKARRSAEESEKRALDRGLQTLEALFPKAGWDRLASYPDLYPYFADIFDLRKGIVNIAPTDPLQQILILMIILEELFFGLRYVSFGTVSGPAGNMERIDTILMEIINEWHNFRVTSIEKEYLPRMADYIRILEGSFEERSSAFTKKVIAELHWIKRLYFLPYYKFETLVPPPFQKKDIDPIYAKIKTLRKYLMIIASGIEQGNRAGGAEARVPCEGIDNPWEPYMFQVSNPLSLRLDALLGSKSRTNASLIYFCLAVTAVLDHLVNSEDSWAYGPRPGPLFRSMNGEGVIPLTGVDNRIDADAIFKQSMKNRQKK
jgi:hypothetical protein